MACRKDGKGRVLRKGEGYRKGDGRYSYVYIDPLGKREKCKSPIRFSLQWLWRTVIMGIKENDKFEVMEE